MEATTETAAPSPVPLFAGDPPAEAAAPESAAPAAEAKADDAPAPWWERAVPGKWKSEEEALKGYSESSKEARRLADEAKSAAEKAKALEEQYGAVAPLFGAPVDADGKPVAYDLKVPEGVELDPVLREGAEEFFRKNNFSLGMAQQALDDVILPMEAGRELGAREYERGRVVEELGGGDPAVAKKLAEEAFNWAGQYFADDPKAVEDLQELASFGAGVLTLHRLREIATGIAPGKSLGGASGLDADGYASIIKTPGWEHDSAKLSKVMEYLNRTTEEAA